MKLNLNKVSNISFMKTYDIHTHKGHWWVSVTKDTPGAVLSKDGNYKVLKDLTYDVLDLANEKLSNEGNRVEKVIVSNLDCMVMTSTPDSDRLKVLEGKNPFLKNELDGNRELLEKSVNSNEYLYATGQPKYGNVSDLKTVIDEAPEKFVGIKLHPKQLDIVASDPVYEPYMQLARDKKIPVLFHSEVAVDWSSGIGQVVKDTSAWNTSDPRAIYGLAKKYPDVAVILGHTGAGGAPAHEVAIDVLLESVKKKDAKLYADISWMDFNNGRPADKPENLLRLIKELKKENALDRMMFGSDVPVGCFGEEQSVGKCSTNPSLIYDEMQNKIKKAIREDKDLAKDSEEIIDRIFYKNADELFFKSKELPVKNNNKSMKVVALIGLFSLLTIGGLVAFKAQEKQASVNNDGINVVV